jgi:hypothetical protein
MKKLPSGDRGNKEKLSGLHNTLHGGGRQGDKFCRCDAHDDDNHHQGNADQFGNSVDFDCRSIFRLPVDLQDRNRK